MSTLLNLYLLATAIIFHNIINKANGQDEAIYDNCKEKTTGHFCMGIKNKILVSRAGQGCFVTNDCEVLLQVDLGQPQTDNRGYFLNWFLYFSTGTAVSFFAAHEPHPVPERWAPDRIISINSDDLGESEIVVDGQRRTAFDTNGFKYRGKGDKRVGGIRYKFAHYSSRDKIFWPQTGIKTFSIEVTKDALYPHIYYQSASVTAVYTTPRQMDLFGTGDTPNGPDDDYEPTTTPRATEATTLTQTRGITRQTTVETTRTTPRLTTVTLPSKTSTTEVAAAVAVDEEKKPFPWWWILLALLLLLALGVMAFAITRKKKAHTIEERLERGGPRSTLGGDRSTFDGLVGSNVNSSVGGRSTYGGLSSVAASGIGTRSTFGGLGSNVAASGVGTRSTFGGLGSNVAASDVDGRSMYGGLGSNVAQSGVGNRSAYSRVVGSSVAGSNAGYKSPFSGIDGGSTTLSSAHSSQYKHVPISAPGSEDPSSRLRSRLASNLKSGSSTV